MSRLTDLQLVELLWPILAMRHVLEHGAEPDGEGVPRAKALLARAADEIAAGVPCGRAHKVARRAGRAMGDFLRPLATAGARVDLVGVAAWRVLAAALEADVLVLPEGTPLSDALELMRPALERAAAGAGEAEWRAALGRLQAHGLYAGVRVAEDA